MSIQLADRVRETTTTTGTGTVDLGGAATGMRTFVAAVGDAAEVPYCIEGRDGTAAEGEWEVGYGTVTDAATDTLARDTVLASSNSGNAVNFSAGTKDVFLTAPADLLRYPIVGRVTYTGADIALPGTEGSWDTVSSANLDVTVPARVGDLITASIACRHATGGTTGQYLDFVTVDSGDAAERYFATGTTSSAAGGIAGLGADATSSTIHRGATASIVLTANDVVSGETTIRLVYRISTTAGNGGDLRPQQIVIVNYGPS